MVNFIIVSKDRAAQLDLLLRTMLTNCHDTDTITVLYTGDAESYKLCMSYHRRAEFIRECSFENDLKNIIKNCKNRYTTILPDDTVFIRDRHELLPYYLIGREVNSVSLRLYPDITFCHPAKKSMRRPEYENKGWYNVWNWRNEPDNNTCWGYPHAIDNVYSNDYLLQLVNRLRFTNPNTLENEMNYNRPREIYNMACGTSAYTVSIPANVVSSNGTIAQSEVQDVKLLRDNFLCGHRIMHPFPHGLKNNTACHVEAVFQWYN